MTWLLNSLIILTPAAWGVSWWYALKWITVGRKNWRNTVSVVALSIVTMAGVLWLPAGIHAAHIPVTDKFKTIDEWTAAAIAICGVALVVGCFGRAKLILPIALTCLGTASFWIGTTIP